MTVVLDIVFASALAAVVSSAYFVVHMLQLEGYRVERYLRHSWESRTLKDATHAAVALVTLAGGGALDALRVPDATYVVAVAALAQAAFLSRAVWARPSKKPIVLTARMYRIIVMTGVLCVALAAPGLWAMLATGIAARGGIALVLAAYAIGASLVVAMPLIGVAALVVLEPLEANLRRGFVDRARRRLEAVSPVVIGVAGSYGKTTTKAALAAVLSAKYRVLATPESYNTLLGVTRTINEQLTDDIEVFIVEMGARHPGDIAQICELVQPRLGVITRLGPQHMEYFKTPETIVSAKTELLRALPTDGVAIVDADGISEFAPPQDWAARTIRVSARPEAETDALLGDIAVGGGGTAFSVSRADGSRVEAKTRLLGRHAAFNCALAVVAGLELGVDPIAIRSGLALLAPVEHRLEIVRNDSVVVIDDAFSSNPDGFAAALEVLASFPGRRILITPGMIELGDQAVPAHIKVAQLAAETCGVIILVGRSWPEEFAQTLRDSGFPETSLHLTASLAEASEVLATLIGPGDVVLFENDLPDNFA